MQIHRIHDEHHQFQTAGNLHFKQSSGTVQKPASEAQTASEAGFLQDSSASQEVAALVDELRQLSKTDEATIQLAQDRFRSGEFLTREAAELVATSLLRDFNF